MDDLVERLRGFEGSDDLGNGDFTVCTQAADRIQALQARIAELEGENFMLAAGACINPGQHGLVGDECGNSVCTAHEALMAEETAHSEALARIAELEASQSQAMIVGEKPTDADREAMRGILWVSTLIDDREAIARAFAAHRVAAMIAGAELMRDAILDTVFESAIDSHSWVYLDDTILALSPADVVKERNYE